MKKFKQLEGFAAALTDINIDTDAIIPKQFLKTIEREGLGKNLFYDQRYMNGYSENTSFILNKNPWRDSKIIVAGDNFGCGSSREHAPWALLDFGIKCIISTSFADIFFNNSSKNGLLLIQLAKKDIDTLFKLALNKKKFIVDLIKQKIIVKEITVNFDIDHVIKSRLINGYDDIGITLKKSSYIENYENDNSKFHAWKNIENET